MEPQGSTTIIIFPVRRKAVASPFNIRGTPDLEYRHANWKAWSSDELTRALQAEIGNFSLTVDRLYVQSIEGGDIGSISVAQDGELYETSLTPSPEAIERYIDDTFMISFNDVLSRDTDAFNPLVDVDLHAVVLLYAYPSRPAEPEYYGHIYTWTKGDICTAIGIRARADIMYMRETYPNIPRVAGYLLEGVRQFAVSKRCKEIVIPYPLKSVNRTLDSYRFTTRSFKHSQLGDGPGIIDPYPFFKVDRLITSARVLAVTENEPLATVDTVIVVDK